MDARQQLLDAIAAFEKEYGGQPQFRDLITDARLLERSVQSAPRADEQQPSEYEKHMRERMGDAYDSRPKSFEDVAESHAKRVAGDDASDDETPSDGKTPAADDDKSPVAGRSS